MASAAGPPPEDMGTAEATPGGEAVNPMTEVLTTYSDLRDGEHTLACVLQGLLDTQVTIDLKSDAVVTGTVGSVDGFMNILLALLLVLDQRSDLIELCVEVLF